jgi:hypothetical protein
MMTMIKKQKKWIALFVALTFMWLLQVSTMPVAAAGTTEQVGSASAEQGPDFVEAAGHKVAPAPKKSILPIILIGVGVVAVAAVLILVVFKTKYDITGSWTFIFTGPSSVIFTITFTGTKASGNYVTAGNSGLAGTYIVEDKNVTLTVNSFPTIQFSGQFTDKDTMTGTYVEGSAHYTWTATRMATTTALDPTPATQSKLFPK